MTGQSDFFRSLITHLDAIGIPYMLSGSYASSFHGEPRATNDIDLVIAPTREQLRRLVETLNRTYYVSPEAAEEALRFRASFNVIDAEAGWKADFLMRKDRPFSEMEFERRRFCTLDGILVAIVAPEDAILSKLEWSKTGESERQFRDALGIMKLQGQSLDYTYLDRWANELGVNDLLERLIRDSSNRP